MTKEKIEELKMLLIFLDMKIMSYEDSLNSQGFLAQFQLQQQYPQFGNRKEEIKDMLDLLNKEQEKL